METEAGLFVSAGVTMPPRPRPREGDAATIAIATMALAEEAFAANLTVLDGASAKEFAEDLASVLPIDDTDGLDLAQAMNRNHSYPFETALVDLMAGWNGHVAAAHEGLVRAWVRETNPQAPFDAIARVTHSAYGGHKRGVAYRHERYVDTARCLFVPDGEAGRFVRDGAYAGGTIVTWESIVVEAPASAGERALFDAMHEADLRHARNRAFGSFSYDRTKAFDDAARSVSAGCRRASPAEVDLRIVEAAARLQAALAANAFDPHSETAAELVGLLAAARSRDLREAFLKAEPVPAPTSS